VAWREGGVGLACFTNGTVIVVCMDRRFNLFERADDGVNHYALQSNGENGCNERPSGVIELAFGLGELLRSRRLTPLALLTSRSLSLLLSSKNDVGGDGSRGFIQNDGSLGAFGVRRRFGGWCEFFRAQRRRDGDGLLGYQMFASRRR